MADEKESKPLLMDKLSPGEKVMLGQVTHHGGFRVLVKLFDAFCTQANEDAIKLDPEKPDYERRLSVRTQRARNSSECISTVMKSVEWHIENVKVQEAAENEEAEDAVAKTFGIHRIPPKPLKASK